METVSKIPDRRDYILVDRLSQWVIPTKIIYLSLVPSCPSGRQSVEVADRSCGGCVQSSDVLGDLIIKSLDERNNAG